MTQNVVDFSDNPTGAGLMDDYLDKEQQNVLTSNSGIQRPSYAVAGTKWLDTSATPWVLKVYDGTDDTIIGTIDPSTHKFIVSNPLTTTGDLLVQGADGKPNRLASGTSESVLTSNGVGQIPSYKVNPIGVKSYLSTYSYKKDDVVVAVVENETNLYKSLIDNNKGNALTDENSWEKVSLGGGGLEIGDIGFAPLGVDEAQNKRRYLNGQVISQSQFESFTNWIKERVALYPSVSTTEENWQAEVTNSKLGQCGKFVIDDTLGTIRLPKVVNINGLQDFALMGSIKAESLPNIRGHFGEAGYGDTNNYSGAFYKYGTGGSNGSFYTAKTAWFPGFDASRSSSTYQDNAPVQQEAVQYPYFIQVATGVEESIDVTREIELNNPFSLFDSKWADHELSNASWVKSNGTFYSGATYVTAYNELLTEYNNAASVEKTDGSITYKLTPKGFKIALANQDEAITELYNNTGVAWYYVLDTANTQFKLPRTKWGFVGCRNNVGNYVPESLPNIKGLRKSDAVQGEVSGAYLKGSKYSTYGTTTGSLGYFNVEFNASRSSSAYQDGAPVQQRATEMYLYFYVGETIQDANVIAAGQVLSTLINKANVDMDNLSTAGRSLVSSWSMPSAGRNINFTLGATGSSYTAPANGYFNVVLNCGGKWANIYTSAGLYTAYGNNTYANANFPVKKGDKITITYESGVTANRFKFIYAEGEK